MAARGIVRAIRPHKSIQFLAGVVRQYLLETNIQVVADKSPEVRKGKRFGNMPQKRKLDSATDICGAIQ
jgi:hypothetical protein